jgi:hypothetical protein
MVFASNIQDFYYLLKCQFPDHTARVGFDYLPKPILIISWNYLIYVPILYNYPYCSYSSYSQSFPPKCTVMKIGILLLTTA